MTRINFVGTESNISTNEIDHLTLKNIIDGLLIEFLNKINLYQQYYYLPNFCTNFSLWYLGAITSLGKLLKWT